MNLTEEEIRLINCKRDTISHCRKVVFAVLSLAILLLLIYGNSFDCAWQFDDESNIINNTNLHLDTFTWQGIKKAIFSRQNSPDFPYRPVVCLTFAFNYYFGGKDVLGYHLVNLIIHWLSSVFLFLFIYHSLNLPKLKDKYGPDSYGLALLATVFWAINPVQVQAVTYIVQRMASLAGLFFILGLYLYLKARTNSNPVQAFLLFGLCFISFLIALGSKENAAMFPVVIFAYETLLIQRDPFSFIRNNFSLILVVVGFTLFIGLGYFYFKDGSIFSCLKGYETRPFTLQERLLTQPRVIIFYISLLLYPLTDRLNIAHSIDLSKSLTDPISTLFSFIAIFIFIIIAIYTAKRKPVISFCILFFFLNHIIESTIFPLEIMFEHRNYVPSMLFFLPFTVGFIALNKKYQAKRIMVYSLVFFVSLVMIGFGHAAHLRNLDWKTQGTLWSDALKKSPELNRTHHNLGRYCHNKHQQKKAFQLYLAALKKSPAHNINESFVTHYNLGKLLTDLKEYNRAEHHLRQTLRLMPSSIPAYNSLAQLFDIQKQHELAHEYALKAYQISPADPITNLNIGLHYLRESQPNRAMPHLKNALGAEELRLKALRFIGIAYKQKGSAGRAVLVFQEALKNTPTDIDLYLHLAELYQRAGHCSRAEYNAQKALGLIRTTQALQDIVGSMLSKDHSRDLKPAGEVVLPLLKKACERIKDKHNEWGELIDRAHP
ncbi:MAG: tetratricopeptide repeat protein [Desulfatiglandales bacterium]